MPSSPILQAWANTVGPSPSICSLKRRPMPALARRGLADFKRVAPQVVAVQLDQVEGVEEGVTVMASVANTVERRHAVVVASNRLPIDDAGARAQACQRLHDQREAAGEVVAGAAIEPHSRAVLAGNDPESIVLNLMQPQAAGRQRVGFGGEARRNEAGRKSTRTGKHDVGINRQRWSRPEGPRGVLAR